MVFCCGLFAFVFFILTLAVPLGIYGNAGYSCSPIDNLNRNEQAYCIPSDLSLTYGAEWSYKADGYIKVYRAMNNTLATTTRRFKWLNYRENIYYDHSYFSIASPVNVSVTVTFRMDQDDADDLKLYWITSKQYYNALHDGYFYESYYARETIERGAGGLYYWTNQRSSRNVMYYLVFSSNYHHVKFDYDVDITYTIYDVSNKKPETCSGRECEFSDMKKGEIFIVDYPATSSSKTYGTSETGPDDFYVWLHDNDVDWSAVFVTLGIFGFLTLFFGAFVVYYLFKYLKKAGKLGKKIVKSLESSSNDSSKATQMTTVSVEATPGATPGAVAGAGPAPVAVAGAGPAPVAVAGAGPEAAPPAYPADPNAPVAPYPATQPYPTDPNAPVAPYPATQPYPADPNAPVAPYPSDPNAVAYPGQPAYPGQSAEPNPYPDGIPPV